MAFTHLTQCAITPFISRELLRTQLRIKDTRICPTHPICSSLIVAEIHRSPNTASSAAEPEMSLIIYSVQQNKWAFCAFSLNPFFHKTQASLN